MNELFMISVALLTGLALGFVFFGGLWLTIRKALASKIPALWFLGSFIVRVGIIMTGFYIIMQDANWINGLICLVGFIGAKFIVIRLTKPYEERTINVSLAGKEAMDEA